MFSERLGVASFARAVAAVMPWNPGAPMLFLVSIKPITQNVFFMFASCSCAGCCGLAQLA